MIRSVRSEQEQRLDAVLLLYILNSLGPGPGRTKLQKTVFLIEFELRRASLVGPRFRFFRYLDGPYSQQINQDLDELARKAFLSKTTLTLTKRGEFLVDLIVPPLRETTGNRRTFEIVDKVLQWCKPRQAGSLLRYVCGLEVSPDESPNVQMKIREVPRFWDIIDPPETGLKISRDLDQLLKSEIALTPSQLRSAKRRLPEIESKMFKNLSNALKNEDQPSAQTQLG
jgi:uncharacterized protein YwgA